MEELHIVEQILGVDWLIVLFAGVSCACATYLVMDVIQRARAAQAAHGGEILVTETTSPLVRTFLPTARTFGGGLEATVGLGRKDSLYGKLMQRVGKRLAAAGHPQGLTATEYMGFYAVCGLAGALIGGLFAILIGKNDYLHPQEIAFIVAILGLLYWSGWLTGHLTRRQTSIRKQLPFSLDLLCLAVEAGLDFTSAMSRMVKKIGSTPLGKEFQLTLHEIQLGKGRAEALRDFAIRCDVPEVRSVVASLVQAEELGAPLGPVLRIMAAQQRERRSQLAEEKAMKAPVKMLFPLVAFIFPTTMLILFGTIALSFYYDVQPY